MRRRRSLQTYVHNLSSSPQCSHPLQSSCPGRQCARQIWVSGKCEDLGRQGFCARGQHPGSTLDPCQPKLGTTVLSCTLEGFIFGRIAKYGKQRARCHVNPPYECSHDGGNNKRFRLLKRVDYTIQQVNCSLRKVLGGRNEGFSGDSLQTSVYCRFFANFSSPSSMSAITATRRVGRRRAV